MNDEIELYLQRAENELVVAQKEEITEELKQQTMGLTYCFSGIEVPEFSH